jgi:hypothetical protein
MLALMAMPPVSSDDLRAAAEAHRELGPEYRDAVVDSFLDKVSRQITAEIDARISKAMEPSQAARRAERSAAERSLLKGMAIGGSVTGIPLLLLGYWYVAHPYEGVRAYVPITLAVVGVIVIAYLIRCVIMLGRNSERD